MGLSENPTSQIEKQAAPHAPVRRPRGRFCLLKGCERRFHPKQARQRYCSWECREAARVWSKWKARLKYRTTARGRQKRNRQSQRYRKRIKQRQLPEKKAALEAARVITRKFFRRLLQAAWLL
jgi:hypothetical protein